MSTLDHDAIALRAYFIWDGEGRPHGRHEAHWFAAQAAATPSAPEIRATAPVTVEDAPAPQAASAKSAARKPAIAKKAAPAKATAPKAPAEAVVAAAALAAPRAARATAKGARNAH